MALARFTIHAVPGEEKVEVDGQDVSGQVAGFQLAHGVNQVPQLVLFLRAGGDVSGVANVTAQSQDQPDGEALAAILSALDAVQLEKDVLDAMGGLEGEAGSYTEVLLRRLVAIVKGEW